jgi:nucleoside 2-deoxyribosyltransferase
MPFAPEFDDVYATIRASVEGVSREDSLRCFRLDESRPAGRITDRLLQEIQSASLCIADLTGNKPNVMWEVGYAMALGRPTIIVTQDKGEMPFDIRDMETLQYDRRHLGETLGKPLKRTIIDTVSALRSANQANSKSTPAVQGELVGELLEQVRELRSMVSQAVKTWNPTPQQAQQLPETHESLRGLEGAWFNRESRAYLYARMIDNELVTPYCYGGNDHLTSAYYGWKRIGEFWFARFCWLTADISGFAFLKQESVDLLTGAWWGDDEAKEIPEIPNLRSGVPVRWERKRDVQIPGWALRFFEEVRREGVVNRLTGIWSRKPRGRTPDGTE